MAQSPQNIDIDPQELERARHMWDGFVNAGKLAIVITCVILAILALAFV